MDRDPQGQSNGFLHSGKTQDHSEQDHWQYVFGYERPKPNLIGGQGLDVSPAVRDYLGLKQTDVHQLAVRGLYERPR